MTILVTGGGGFLGSHVVDRLRATGEDPFVASRSEHDLVDPSASRRLFEAARPEVVFHLAAEVGGIVHAATMGNHLRFGMAATYGGSLSRMREDNTVDYPWLCFALASTMAEYARLIDSGASEDARAPYVEAILGGLTPDAQAFLTEPVTALAAHQADRTQLVDLFRAHREAFLADAVRHRPIDERFTPFGLMFNFSHNVLKGLVADSLLWGEASALGFNDLLTALPHASAKNTGRTTLAKTLMGYARKNPEKVAGRMTPVIVYDAQAGRRAFAAAQQAIAGS